jgi:hypothetical protein
MEEKSMDNVHHNKKKWFLDGYIPDVLIVDTNKEFKNSKIKELCNRF